MKVLDFGLAKAMDPAGASSAERDELADAHAPATTQAGMILGTAAYMSPEQARGKAVDRRADIWAFGVVLFEMLTGTRAFEGEDISDTLARAEDRAELDSAAGRDLPRAACAGCCGAASEGSEAAPARHRRGVRLALEGAFETAGAADDAARRGRATLASWRARCRGRSPARRRRADRRRCCCGRPGARRPCPRRASCSPASAPTRRCRPASARRRFCRRTARRSRSSRSRRASARLFVRKLDQLQAAALAGTDGAASPFFSPDGQWIAFFAGGKLKKVSVTGGAAVTLCDAPAGPRRHLGRRRHDHLHADERSPTRRSCASRRPAARRRSSARSAQARRRSGGRRRCRAVKARALHRALGDGQLGRGQPRRRAAVGRGAEDRRPRRLLRPVRAERPGSPSAPREAAI